MDFSIISTRRVLLRARDDRGNVLPPGSSVISEDEKFLTNVATSGKIFLDSHQLGERLVVNFDGEKRCRLEYSLPEKADPNVYFESADATCKPI